MKEQSSNLQLGNINSIVFVYVVYVKNKFMLMYNAEFPF